MSGSSNNPHTRAIAQFISAIRYEDIPAEVIARIKLLILDSLGCALYGTDLEWSRILRHDARPGRHDTRRAACGERRSGCRRRMPRWSTAR